MAQEGRAKWHKKIEQNGTKLAKQNATKLAKQNATKGLKWPPQKDCAVFLTAKRLPGSQKGGTRRPFLTRRIENTMTFGCPRRPTGSQLRTELLPSLRWTRRIGNRRSFKRQ